MVKSLYTGVSGLKTHQQRMDVIGNNIANVNTIGYKTDVVTFADVYYQTKRSPSAATSTLGGINPRMAGYGVKMNSVTANMTQSGYTQSDSKTDLALDGKGFFQVMDGAGNIFYTRAGNFTVDNEGYLVNADGYHVLGVTGESDGVQASSEIIRFVVPDTDMHASSATKMINGTNVTLTVTAPSDYTDMSVSFQESEYPFASYSNNILTIFFNSDEQYNSEEAFDQAIQQALQAGGVSLPDSVELKFQFESIPDNPEATLAQNSVDNLKYGTVNDSVEFHGKYPATNALGAAITKDASVIFHTDDVLEPKVQVELTYTAGSDTQAAYTAGSGTTPAKWTITIGDNSTADEINTAIKKLTSAHPEYENLTCSSFVMPRDPADRAAVCGTYNSTTGVGGLAGTKTTQGSKEGTVNLEVAANLTKPGEYANNYKVTFAYLSGYGKTSAVWDKNTLTINVCNDTTNEDIAEAIHKAARGDDKKDITVKVSGILEKKGDTDPGDGSIMNAGEREAFFSGHPSIRPTGGNDSFFTKTAKSLGTFALEDGRQGEEQTYGNLKDITIQTDGTIIGLHPILGYISLGRVDIATFDNPNGLQKVGGTNFAATVASGDPKLCVAGKDGAGTILNGTLEISNVDLADEFTNMITTQRGYQANSRVVTVSDTMLEELLSLKR